MDSVEIYEVGPRDGLQNEKVAIPSDVKIGFIRALISAGLKQVEVTSLVSAKWVPQLADAGEVLSAVDAGSSWVLVPNEKGLDRALALGVQKFAFLTATSDSFLKANLNTDVERSLETVGGLVANCREAVSGSAIRVYISTAVQCPYEGKIPSGRLGEVTRRVARLLPDQISIGETLGVATPTEVVAAAREVQAEWPAEKTWWHLHDTWGTGVANAFALLGMGYRNFDSSAAGLGGCPYAPGAGGNVSTEDLVYAFEREGLKTGIDLKALARASLPVLMALGREPSSKAQRAVLALL